MKIHLLHRQQTIEHDNQIPLLSRLEQLGIHHEYQCRSGYCGSCRVKIKKRQSVLRGNAFSLFTTR